MMTRVNQAVKGTLRVLVPNFRVNTNPSTNRQGINSVDACRASTERERGEKGNLLFTS